MAGSPAFQAGIRAGDVIMSVDGRSPSGQTLDTVLDWLRGPAGTDVAIEVQRPAAPAPLRLRVTRAVIELSSVRGARRTADGAWDYRLATAEDIAYLRIAHFATTTPDEVATALAAITASRPRALVLDLRHDPGGSLTAAIRVADQFLDHGRIVSERARGGVTTHHDATPGSGTTLPVALLVDEATMSAAEIVAAALQDNGRALVVGARSYGKATVQELFPLADGAGAYRLTTEDYLRPSGGPLERHLPGSDPAVGGVAPDDGLAVTVTAAEAETIGQSLATLDVTSTLIGLPASDGPATPDAVLAAACAALRAGRAPTRR
jgi:carboxyl-terminal processing protease